MRTLEALALTKKNHLRYDATRGLGLINFDVCTYNNKELFEIKIDGDVLKKNNILVLFNGTFKLVFRGKVLQTSPEKFIWRLYKVFYAIPNITNKIRYVTTLEN